MIHFNSETLVCVPCDSVTLVKDLRVFIDRRYKAGKTMLIDMFPRMAHIECNVNTVKGNAMRSAIRPPSICKDTLDYIGDVKIKHTLLCPELAGCVLYEIMLGN